LVTGAERLDRTGLDRILLGTRLGNPDQEVLGAWLAKESVRDVYLTNHPGDAEILLDKAIAGCRLDPVGEVRCLGRTLARWRTEILNHHRTGASNGPSEGLNLLVKKVKRAGHGVRSFANYRLRILLHAGGVAGAASVSSRARSPGRMSARPPRRPSRPASRSRPPGRRPMRPPPT
jgi:hypothetical protein